MNAGEVRRVGEWLVEVVNEHTCGTARDGYYGAIEPGCGQVPIAKIADRLAAVPDPSETGLAEKVRALAEEFGEPAGCARTHAART